MTFDTFNDEQASRAAYTKLAAVALIVFQVALLPFAFWHGSLDTVDGAASYTVVSENRSGWYVLHYATVICIAGINVSLVGLLAWFSIRPTRTWGLIATILLLISSIHLAMAFGAEAIAYYYAADTSLIEQDSATTYIQAWIDGDHYGLLVVSGLFATWIGEAIAVSVFYRATILPLNLRRLGQVPKFL